MEQIVNSFFKNLYLQIILIAFLHIVLIEAQAKEVFFEKISYKEGLYQNTIWDIVQDKNGFIWMGTPKGLIKYDGLNFKVFEQYEFNGYIEPIKKVYALHVDKDGNIWAGSSSGIYKYDQRKEKIYKIENTHIIFNQRCHFVPMTNDRFFIWATSGIYLITDSNKLINVPIGINDIDVLEGRIESLHQVRDSLYVFGTHGGLGTCIFNSALSQFDPLKFYPDFQQSTCLCKETESILWLGFGHGVKRLKLSEKGEFEEWDFSYYKGYSLLKNSLINDIFKASDGCIYAATTGNGLIRINTDEKEIEVFRYDEQQASISWDNVFSIFEDHTGILWFGTGQGGLTKYDTHKKPFYHLQHVNSKKNSLSHNHVNRILFDSRKHLWVGTFYGGLNVSKQPISNASFNNITFDVVQPIGDSRNLGFFGLIEIDGFVLINNTTGLYLYNLETNQFLEVPNESILGKLLKDKQIISFEKDYRNRLWLGCSTSIFCIDYNNDIHNLIIGDIKPVYIYREKNNTPLKSKVNQIYCSRKNKVFIATENGFFVASDAKDKITLKRFQHKIGDLKSISQNEITSIFEDKKNRIWLGTFNGGLNLVIFNENQEIIGFKNPQNGINLPEKSIFCIESDQLDNLWLSTYNGIYKYNYTNNQYTNYSTSDGLTTNLFHKYSSIKTEDGMLIFGSINGLTSFYPEQIGANTSYPKVSFTCLKVFNKPVRINEKLFGKVILSSSISKLKHIELPYKCDVITLEFAAVHMASPQKNKFYYRLVGIDKDWIETSVERNFCNYTNLSPGDYQFQITASNSDGVKNDDILELGISILPPWYLTKLAIILFILCGLGLFYLIFYYVRKLTLLRHALQVEKIEKRKEKEIYEAKQRFFTNISHELKTPLSLILGPLDKISTHLHLNDSDKKSFHVIQRNANRLHRLINQIMDFRKLEQNKIGLSLQYGNINSFICNILISFEEELKRKKQQVIFNTKEEPIFLLFDADKLEKVIYNILFNAIKHTPETGDINIATNVDQNGKRLVLSIMNQGKGISEDNKSKIFERFYQIDKTETGTGIGLAIAKSFIELHHGSITEKGTFGKNAIFEIVLPVNTEIKNLKTKNQKDIIIHEPKPLCDCYLENETKFSSTIDKVEILVVEDNAEMLDFIGDSFSEKYKVIKAFDGQEAFELAEKNIPEIIITDVMMPKMEGKEFCRMVKENPKTNHIPVIMLTAKDTVEQQIEGLNAGADAYLTKPFHMNHLQAQINNLLDSRKKIQQSFKQKYGLGLKNIEIEPVDEQLIKKFILFIEENISDPDIKVADAAREMSYSYMQFNRKIKAITGESVGQFLSNYRLNRAKLIFEADPRRSISEVMYSVGFKNPSYFSKCFREQFDMTPKEFKLGLAKISKLNIHNQRTY